MKAIKDQPGRAAIVKLNPNLQAAFSGRGFEHAILAQKAHTEIVGTRDEAAAVVARSTLESCHQALSALRHDREVTVVAHPGTRLVRRADALDLPIGPAEGPTALVRLKRPCRHRERCAEKGQSISAREVLTRVRSLQWIDEIQKARGLWVNVIRGVHMNSASSQADRPSLMIVQIHSNSL